MEKSRQKQLQNWLKQQNKLIRKPLTLNLLFAIISTILLVVQTWILAGLLHDLIIAQLPREQLLPSFIALPIIFLVRAGLDRTSTRLNSSPVSITYATISST